MKHIIFALSGLLVLSVGHYGLAETSVENQTPVESLGGRGGDLNSDISTISISETQYYVGAGIPIGVPLLSVVLDGPLIPTFGIGHAVQGRYMNRGWIFTAGELVFLGSTFYFIFSAGGSVLDGAPLSDVFESGVGMMISLLGLFSFMIWEAVDVWFLPSNIKVSSPFELSPFYSFNDLERSFQERSTVPPRYKSLGLSVKYKF